MSTTTITVPQDYPYVLGGLVLMSAQLFFANIMYVSRVRKQVFNKELLEKKFGEEHKKATGQAINSLGYPDTGNGRYSEALPYKDWLRFNIAQRIHYNFLEFFTPFAVITLVAGLHKPCITALVCGGMILSRAFFHIGYVLGNANNPLRVIGAIGSDIGMVANLVIALCGLCSWLKLC